MQKNFKLEKKNSTQFEKCKEIPDKKFLPDKISLREKLQKNVTKICLYKLKFRAKNIYMRKKRSSKYIQEKV